MKLKFLRNVLVDFVHRERGSVHDIAEKDAALLIADGAAVKDGAKPETTAAPMAAVETASVETPKAGKAKGK